MYGRRSIPLAACLLCAGMAAAPLHAATVTVNTTADNTTAGDGLCTLREAVTAINNGADFQDCVGGVNAWGTTDTIAFNIPGAGVQTIAVTSALPNIVKKVVVDGTTQPGSLPNTLAGTVYPNAQGLDTRIKVEIDGTNAGAAKGLVLEVGSSGSVIRGLSIVNFQQAGVLVNSKNNYVLGSFIGLRADGNTVGPNSGGIRITDSGNTVGGTIAANRNLIAGNYGVNVTVSDGHHNTIAGNLIGTDLTGTNIRCAGGCSGVLIQGVNGLATGNAVQNTVIAGHQLEAIHLSAVMSTAISGNAIGIGAGGVSVPNGAGIVVRSGPGGATVLVGLSLNGIAFNGGDGIAVYGDSTYGDPTGVNISPDNAIWQNGGLGINLVPVGEAASTVTANDLPTNLDADTGPNGLQNFPVIQSATVNGTGGVDIALALDSSANGSFGLYAFASDSCDGSGYGEGQYPHTFAAPLYNTDGAGHLATTLSFGSMPTGWAVGKYVTVFAYDANNMNTSEFSACAQIMAAGANHPPVANPDSYNTPYNTALNVAAAGVLTNDTDQDGNPLTAVLATGAGHGSLTLNANGSFTYTPTSGYSGPDSFTYYANDGTVNSTSPATVSITVSPPANHPPVAANDSYTTGLNTTLAVPAAGVLANDSDPDGNPLTAVLAAGPSHAALTLSPDGSFVYTPNAGYSGPDSFTYYANDGTVNSLSPATVSVTVSAQPVPTLSRWAMVMLAGLLGVLGWRGRVVRLP